MPDKVIRQPWRARVGLALLLASIAPSARSQVSMSDVIWTILDVLQITAAPVGMLGEGGAAKGEIWIAASDGSNRRRVASDLEYAWPVFTADGKGIVALHGGDLVRLSLYDGERSLVAVGTQLSELIGIRPDGSVIGIFPEGPLGRLASVTGDGSTILLPAPVSREERRLMAALHGESRAYRDGRELLVDRAEYEGADRARRGFDVYVASQNGRVNISQCGTAACGQPSLSRDGQWVAYIRDPNM